MGFGKVDKYSCLACGIEDPIHHGDWMQEGWRRIAGESQGC